MPNPGVYGFQVDVNYEPALISVSDLQLNSAFKFVVLNDVDNQMGKIMTAASRQGNVPGLTGNIPLLTFAATAGEVSVQTTFASDQTTFTLENVKVGNSQAQLFDTLNVNYTVLIMPMPTITPTTTPTSTPTGTPTPTNTPTPILEPNTATVTGRVILAGVDWSGATVTIDDTAQSDITDTGGNFAITDVSIGTHTSITANAVGFLPAVCNPLLVTASETILFTISLVGGDLNDDGVINIADVALIDASFGETGTKLLADLNRDGIVDILDMTLAGKSFGKGTQIWNCLGF